eukprot:jgi/Orpsp1_1/1189366/evm.model.d7180000071458.1
MICELSKYIELILNDYDNDCNKMEIISKRNSKEFPITSQQLGVYIDSIKEKDSIIYNIPSFYKINSNIDKEKIKKAILKIFDKQEILRSKYFGKEINGKTEIYGFIDDECSLKFEEYSYENIETFIRPFDLSKAPLIRVGFIGNEVLLIDMHHIISDGYTMNIIVDELNKYYYRKEVEELEIQYCDYAIYLNEKKNNGKLNEQIEIYKEIFSNEYEILNIPTTNKIKNEEYNNDDYNNENMECNCYERIIDKSTSEKIDSFIKYHNISKTAFFISIYGYILSKYSGQDIIYTSVMSANRNNHYVENMAGMFVSTLPLLLKYNNEENKFIDIMKENMNTLVNIYNNQDISFAELNKILKLKKINNSFIFQPKAINENIREQNNSIINPIYDNENNINNLNSFKKIENKLKNNNNTKFDITFDVIENENDYLICIQYNSLKYDSIIITSILNSYIEVIQNIQNLENNNIKKIEYIPINDKVKIIKEFNSSVNKYECSKLYHEEFRKITEKYPDRCAISFNENKITYKELDEMSNSLAHYLRSQGVQRNDIIPIICDRSPFYIIGILGISKAGGAFLPIDKNLPINRIQFILMEINPNIVIFRNCKDIIEKINSSDSIKYSFYDLEKHNYSLNCNKINNINIPEDICYILFTSGTTGKPKGTYICHFNLSNFQISYCNNKNTESHTVYNKLMRNNNINNILGITNFSFDASNVEVMLSLNYGLNLVLADEIISNDINLLSEYINKNNVDFIQATPTRLKLFMENDLFRKSLKKVKSIALGGEELSVELCNYINKYSNCKIYNEYGPTECTINTTVKEIDNKEKTRITIGKPLCNFNIYILDKYMKPVPIGVEGEIYIGGYGVGKGYLNRPELTKEKFIENPFNYDNDEHNRVMYRTGDLGRWTSEGEIEYLGRIDFQVKIHGQRIEIGEIESTILEINEIKQCVVIDKKKENGEKYLVCYYILRESEGNISNKDIRKYLSEKLPRYMIPNYYKKIDKIPLSNTGKLNKRSLPEINKEDFITESYVEPENEIETIICKIYSDIFNMSETDIGRMHDFYDLGGDSLNAIRISSRIEKEFKVKINIKDIMSHPVICELSQYINLVIKEDNNKVEIIRKHNNKEFPITSQQLGVYIDSIKEKNSLIYNVPSIYKLNNNIDKEKIKNSILNIFKKHEVLRSRYYGKEINGKTEIYGFIDDECSLKFEEYSYENIETFIRPFDLSKAPLIRVGFIGNEVLLIDMHHIISDGYTMNIIMDEKNKYYYGEEVEELEIQYSDYAINLNEKKNNGKLNKQIEIYKEIFSNEYEILNIPKINKIKNEENNNNDDDDSKNVECNSYERVINKSTSEKINSFIKHYNISKTAFFISIYGYILSKYSGQDIIYTSVINANRNNHYVEKMVGMFVSTLPLLLKYDNEKTQLIDIIKENMNTLVNIYNNQDISFAELIKILNLKKINNSFIFQPKSITKNIGEQSNSIINPIYDNENNVKNLNLILELKNILVMNNNSKFDISFGILENEDDYLVSIEYNSLIYDSEIIKNIINSYIDVIQNIEIKGNNNIKEIEYIPIDEKERIIKEFNAYINKDGCDKLHHEEISKIAEKYPDRCAIVFNGSMITYKELNEKSNSLAHYLRSQGIQRNDIIPIISDRSPLYVIGILGISKAGGAFLPIDKNLPIDRIQFILEDVRPKLILYNNCKDIIDNLKNKNEEDNEYNIYDLGKHNYSLNINAIKNINSPNDICYVIFTSGTTGKPKGTLITYYNIYNFIRPYNEDCYRNGNNGYFNVLIKESNIKNILGITNFSFDPSFIELLFSLIHGLKLILVDEITTEDINLLSKCIIENEVEFLQITPTRLNLYLESEEFKKALNKLKVLVLGGEELPLRLCKMIREYSNCRIFNSYGPTECTIDSSFVEMDKDRIEKGNITIGKSLCHSKLYILDRNMKPVPVGVEGEIFIGGYGVGKGYLNRPELTKEKFIENPFNYENNEYNRMMYKTGDLGRWNSNGEVEYLGRIDFQVKINGQRVELGEIENKVLEIAEIQQCVVIDKKKDNGEKYLVCYYILREDEEDISDKSIRKYLNEKLPRYMVPNYYIKINEIPLSSTDKLDRKALPEPNKEDFITESYVAPENEIETIICKIYSDIFNMSENEIGRMHDFYDLGGDSLNAIRVSSRIEKELKIKINIKDIMNYPVIYEFSKYIESLINNNNNDNNKIEIIRKCNNKEFPITSQQLGVYIDSIKETNSLIYNVPSIYKLNENINKEMIKNAILKIFKKQEILRSRYYGKEINNKTEIYGFIDDECSLKFEEYSYENIETFIRPFDLSKAPLIRVGFIGNEVLLIDMHHIISDGYTMNIIMDEINKYYNGEEVEELEIQYSDYSIYLNEKKNNGKLNEQIEIYKEIFSNEYEILNIPSRNIIKEENINNEFNESNRCEQVIDKSISEKINAYMKYHNISKTAFFISIYGYILSKYSGQDIIYTSVMSANRNNHYVENMAGMFVSTLPLLLKYNNEEKRFVEIIKENMEILINIYNNQDISFAELTNILNLKKINNSFIFQPKAIAENNREQNDLVVNPIYDNENNINNLNSFIKIENKLKNNNNTKFDITFDVIENENYYLISIEYNSIKYDSIIINNILSSYIEVIKNIQSLENNYISNIEYIPINDKVKIIKEFNSSVNKNECDKLYHEEFRKIAEKYPDRCAISFNESNITYKELDEMSNSLAHYLRSEGVQRNDIIPIICDRSPFYIIGILGISKAGGAFLPIDKNLPINRIQFILMEVNPNIVIYRNCKDIIEKISSGDSIKYSFYDLEKHIYSLNCNKINNINIPEDTCYILFTSGTTGKPKGTYICHFNLSNFQISYCNNKNRESHTVYNKLMRNNNIHNILGITNFSFDASNVEVMLSLNYGLNLVLADEIISNDINLLSEYINKNNVDFIQATPTRLKLFMENDLFRKSLKKVKSIALGGEELSVELCNYINKYSNCKIYNEYGPTECTINTTVKEIDNKEKTRITIGKPLCNFNIYILDKYMKPVPIGVEGEIYIGGYGVGKGYLNRSELTKEKFIENPFNYDNDERNRVMYRTGDLGRWTSEGEIEYLGRIDFQVKIHGQRIEIGEIESTILEINEIKQCVIIDKKKENGEKYLVCYYILQEGEIDISNKDIRKYLSEKLPRYMIPNYYKKIDKIPLSNTGKLNKRALPEINKEDFITESYVAPENEIETIICKIYSDIFNMSETDIGRMHDFYDLGGDSLNAIRISSRIEKEFKVKINIKDIMSHPMICELSQYIKLIIKEDNNKVEIIRKHNNKEFPITSQQLGVYVDSIKEKNSLIYNIPSIYKLNENVDKEKIKKSILKIFDKQEILRSKYFGKEINDKTEIYGFIDDECSLKFEEYSYENIETFIRPFDLSKAPLIRVGFIGNEVLLIDMHHIISDGYTMNIIMDEINKYYYGEE